MGSKPVGLSASRAAAIVGLSSYQTPFEVWQQLQEERQPGFNAAHGLAFEPFEGNAATRWGTAFELPIIKRAELAQSDAIVDRERLCVHPTYSFITCHLDGVFSHSRHNHEGKTTTTWLFRSSWGEPGTDKIPEEYQVQVQQQMTCSKAEVTDLSVLCFPERVEVWEEAGISLEEINGYWVPVRDGIVFNSLLDWARALDEMGLFHQYIVEAQPVAQKGLVEALADFWNVHVLGEKTPEPQNYDDVRRMFPAPIGTVVADDQLERNILEYRDIHGEFKKMEARCAELKTQIVFKAASIAERPADKDSSNKIVIVGASGKKLASYGMTKRGPQFRA